MRKGVTVLGYYGANNTGDEAILHSMLEAFRREGITDITVLSYNPEKTCRLHNVNSIYIGRKLSGLVSIFNQLKKSRLFILGGGGLFHDHSGRVVPYWLSRVLLAHIAKTPVIYYAHGVGPLHTDNAKFFIRIISNKVKKITVRDEPSFRLLSEIGIDKSKVELTADPAILLEVKSNGRELLESEGVNFADSKIKLAVCLRSWKEESYLPVLIDTLKNLKNRNNVQYIFLPFQSGQDEAISKSVLDAIDDKESLMVKGDYTPEQITAILKEVDGIIGMRLHALILGSISFKPLYALSYDPKVENFMERIGQSLYSYNIEIINNQKEQFMQSLINWIDNRELISNQLRLPVQEMQNLAARNNEIVKELMK